MRTTKFFPMMLIASTMLGAMALSSCSHDEYMYSEEKVETNVNDTYAAAFEKAFGKVGPNVDWGFGRQHAYSRGLTRAEEDRVNYASNKGNMQPSISFPTEDLGADDFTIPEGTQPMPNGEGGVGPYYIDETTEQVWSWSGQCVIYVKGIVDLTNKKFQLNTGTKIYLTKNSSLKLGSYAADGLNISFYIAKDATLEVPGLLKIQTYPVYNHGTIKAGSYEITSSSILYNVGKLETSNTGSVILNSNTDRIVNDGTIECASVTLNAGAVQNNYQWTVSGTTTVNSNNSGWVNNGQWKTRDYAYIGGSENVINNCYLWVTHDFEMNISSNTGAFKIDAGGGVLTQNFYGGRDSSTGAVSGPFKIVMGEKAVFKVENIAQLESGRYNISDTYDKGIFGPLSGEYAVFQAKNIVRESTNANTWGAVTYRGHLYVSAESHFAQGNDGMESHKFIFTEDGFTLKNIYISGEYSGDEFSKGKPSIDIPQTPCSPGFKGISLYRVIAEDLSASDAGDFDFNDVVFDVVKAEGGKTTLKLICAGGTLPLRVRGANEAEGREVHEVFGQTTPDAQGKYQMFNTGTGPTVDPATFTVDGTYITPADIKGIIIEVYKNNSWMELKATTGEAACKILVDDTFKPVVERRNIADENNKFTNYVQGSFDGDFWWK